ncbi:MAG: hypothetical protein H7257_01140 [Taibaiella sp.]|nr:hypothetical protein [Taibaiella sp.]
MRIITLISAVIICSTNNIEAQVKGAVPFGAAPGSLPVIVYKTKKNYKNLVPVTLSEDRTKIVAYPDPSDFKSASHNWLPVKLHKGYWLDRRGINRNVAFLNITYKQYALLPKAPAIEKLYSLIKDNEPLTEFCNCGQHQDFPHPVKKLNSLIDKKKLDCSH